jgi:alpha-glucosidase
VDPEYEVFRQGLAMDAYLRTADGPYARGKVWPGECFFPDFTQADVRDWWGSLHRDLIRKAGVHGVWNDMNEPAVFDVPSKTLPEDVRFHYDGHPCSHRKAHNIYGMQMSRATREGLRDLAYPRRPFVITRATYAGGQRYAAVWTGDNVASWDHLRLAVTQCQRLSVSGFSFVGSDIGGFVDNSDGELLVRWLQAALFHPLYRMHSMGFNVAGDDSVDDDAVAANQSSGRVQDQEPWSFGEPFTALAREAIRLRYRLLPALYTAFWQYSQFGTPMLRPLLFEDPTLGAAGHHGQTFLAGDHLLLSPVTACGELIHTTLLPTGVWYDLQTGTAYAGPGEITTRVYLHDIPMYLRAGGVLPMGPVRRNTAEPVTGPLTLHIALGTSPTASCYYEDAGEGYAYQDGQYRLHRFEVSGAGGRYEVSQTTEGSAAPAYTTLVIQLYGAGNQVPVITCEGQLYTPARTRAGWEVVGIPVGFSTLRVEARTNETV